MFVKFTRLDNAPIWINAAFVVTVEPRKGGGSVVVPIGDGLDYDVRETPEVVLERLAGAPAPAVVPVPPPKSMTVLPADVSRVNAPDDDVVGFVPAPAPAKAPPLPPAPEPESAPAAEAPAPKRKPRARAKTKTTAKAAAADQVADTPPPAPVEAPASPAPDPVAAPAPDPAVAAEAPDLQTEAIPPDLPALDLSAEQVERLRRMGPRSMRRLLNSLAAQFPVADPQATANALAAHGILAFDGNHVVWNARA